MSTATATAIEQLVDQYLAVWNESDPDARRALIARTWTKDGTYLDPLLEGEGHADIDATIGGAQPQFPGLRFRRTSDVDAHHDVVRFSWALGPEEDAALSGVDFGVVADRLFRSINGFFDFMPEVGEQEW
jgi:hypothetical protein